MKRKNLLFVVMTALFLLVSPGLRAASSGSCGTSVTWTLDDQGVLTIEGTGAMNNYENEKFAPWRASSIEGQIKQVVIKDGVTTIGNYAFQYCENMTSVTIPSTVTSIGADAFYQCSGLTSVTIPSTVTELKEFAFYRAGLTSVAIPESVTSIGVCTFAECTGLTSVTLPSTMTSIGEMAFALCEGLKSVTIPSSVTSIEDDAFSGCIGLEKIESLAATPPACTEYTFYNVDKDKCVLSVPENSIAAYKDADGWKDFTNIEAAANSVVASGDCGTNVKWTLDGDGVLTIEGTGAMTDYDSSTPWANLTVTKVVIKDGVTTIGKGAFSPNCTGLTSVTIPTSVTSIGEWAFSNCTSLTSVTIPNSVTSIGEWAFGDCRGLKSVTISSSATSIGACAFYNCTALEKMESLAVAPPTCGEDVLYGVNMSKCVLYVPKKSVEAYKAADGWKDFTNIEGVTNVVASGKCGDNLTWTLDGDGELTIEGTGAMTDYDSSSAPWRELTFTKVVIKDGVTTIGIKAFSNSDELTSVDIPSTVTSIGESAFFECEGLTSVTIPNSVTSIGDDAFSDCTGLESVTLSNSLTSIASGLFYNCTALTGVEIPNSVTSIEKAAFAQCEELKSVTLSNSLTTIVKNAFAKCSALTSVTFPETLTSIGSGAFANCSALTSVTIPASVTIIEKGTFLSCSGLTSVTIPNTVTSIGECAFYECEGLTSLTIPASVTSIEDEAFMDCKGLTKIESLSENPPACRNNAFSGIDTNKCTLYVPKKSIEAYKEADEWKDFTNIEALAAGTQSGTCGDNVTWTLDSEGVLTIEGTGAMADYSTTSPAPWKDLSITSVVIGDGVTTIGDYVFQDCEGLASVTIPASVTSIGSGAFANCTALTSVTIPASVTTIGWAAFFGCSELMKIESLAENPPVCGTDAFSGVDTDNCVLTVPGASVKAYRAADQWKEFSNVATGINGVAQENNVVVSASNGVITVTGAAGNAVTEVYSTTGALVYRGTSKTVNVPSAGMYIVKAAGKKVKVNAAR